MLSCRFTSNHPQELTSLSRVSVFRKLDCTPSAAVFTLHFNPPQNAAEGVRSRFSTAVPLQRFGVVASPPALCMQPNYCFRCRFWGAVPLQPNGCSHQPPPNGCRVSASHEGCSGEQSLCSETAPFGCASGVDSLSSQMACRLRHPQTAAE